ncbi:MAG: energy transducer TonB [Bacteroidales bacterium]
MTRKNLCLAFFVFILPVFSSADNGRISVVENEELIFIGGGNVMSLQQSELIIDKVSEEENTVFFIVDEYPKFSYPGGYAVFFDERIVYPERAVENHVEGLVWVNFVVEKDGSVSNPHIIRGIGYGCDEEVLRVVRGLPKLEAGKIGGNQVRVAITLPIRYQLNY